MKYEKGNVPSNFVDLTGNRFGKLTVLRRVDNKNVHTNWLCVCDCGKRKEVLGINLKRGLTKSCGCLHNEEFGKSRFIDLTSKRFGKLVALKRAENRGKETFWLCQCDCGNTKEINASRLKSGKTKSCGCYKSEYERKIVNHTAFNKTHGMSDTRLYRIYNKMKLRCYSKTNHAYKDYGGRGITICQEWLDDFMNFYNWAMKNGYEDNLSIDRIDNDKGYDPENCRWVSKKVQANNTRSTIFLTCNGETKSASEWSEITGIPRDTITSRKRNGWSDEQCIKTKVGEKRV